MALYEVWCSHCNEAHDPHTNESDTVRNGLVSGARVWVLSNEEEIALGKGVKQLQSVTKSKRNFKLKGKKEEIKEEVPGTWKKGVVLKRWGNFVKLRVDDALSSVKVIDLDNDATSCLPANSSTTDDMRDLHYIHDPAILENLRLRAKNDQPYTFIGNVLVSINPLHSVPEPAEETRSLNLPHPTTVADRAYRKMCFAAAQAGRSKSKSQGFGNLNQSIVITGESGAGKSEASKRVICYLVERESESADSFEFESQSPEQDEIYDFQDRLIGSDPILESFGNAQTLRNPNSSRFGKFLKLKYKGRPGEESKLTGAQITTYLLERSRVSHQEIGEKNFRIFYQLLTYSNKKVSQHLGFPHAGFKFNYLGGRRFSKADRDRIGVVELQTALAMSKMEVKTLRIFQVVAAILHLGNIEFYDEDQVGIKGRDELVRAEPEERTHRSLQLGRNMMTKLSINTTNRKKTTETSLFGSFSDSRISRMGSESGSMSGRSSFAYIARNTHGSRKDYDALEFTARLFKVDPKTLEELLLFRVINVAGKRLKSPLDAASAIRRRDALAKDIYALLFDFIVGKLNDGLGHGVHPGEAVPEDSVDSFIGVLDIFGFESFFKNGFEQLLINYSNEILLSLFTRQVLIGESEIYQEEGLVLREQEFVKIDETKSKYEVCLSLFEGKDGLLAAIDTQGKVSKPSDMKLINKIHEIGLAHTRNGHDAYIQPHPSKRQENFIIRHYAAPVVYTVTNFLEKNDQSLPPEIKGFFLSSQHEIIKNFPSIAKGRVTKNNRSVKKSKIKSSKKTVVSVFAEQLGELKMTLSTTGCSYIRCVKPNATLYYNPNEEDEGSFNAKMNKVLSTIEVKKQNFSNKRRLSEYAAQRNMNNMQSMFNKKLTTYAAKASKYKRDRKKYFDSAYISLQLKNMGIYDAVAILKSGLPAKVSYSSLMEMYGELLPLDEVDDIFFVHRDINFRTRMYVAALLEIFGVEKTLFRLGKTRIFLEHSQLDKIKNILTNGVNIEGKSKKKRLRGLKRKMRAIFQNKQRNFRRTKLFVFAHFLNSYKRIHGARVLQRAFREYLKESELIKEDNERYFATLIQSHWRGFLAREAYEELRLAEVRRSAEMMMLEGDEGDDFSSELSAFAIDTDDTDILDVLSELQHDSGVSEYPSSNYRDNATRNTLISYFNRRTTKANVRRLTRHAPSGVYETRLNNFRHSTLASAASIFNTDVVNQASDEDWEHIDMAFPDLDMDGEVASEPQHALTDNSRSTTGTATSGMQKATFQKRTMQQHEIKKARNSGTYLAAPFNSARNMETTLSSGKASATVLSQKSSFGSNNSSKSLKTLERRGTKSRSSKNFTFGSNRKVNILEEVPAPNKNYNNLKKRTMPAVGGVMKLAAMFGQTMKKRPKDPK